MARRPARRRARVPDRRRQRRGARARGGGARPGPRPCPSRASRSPPPRRSRPAARRSPRPAPPISSCAPSSARPGRSRSRASVQEALRLLERARDLAESPACSDVDRAAVLFRLGVCRYHLSSISTAISLLSSALELADRSGLPCDQLRGDILDWRSRCYRRQRDWQAAQGGRRAGARAGRVRRRPAGSPLRRTSRRRSSPSARATGCSPGRTRSGRAAYYEELEDRANVGRLLNNLGGLNFTLGNPERAVELLTSAHEVALEAGDEPEAGLAMCSLAQVHLDVSEAGSGRGRGGARHSRSSATGRTTCRESALRSSCWAARCSSRIAWTRLKKCLRAADRSFEQLSSVSHRAAAWVAQGDLARKRNADREAARLYRRAAEALQDFRF